MDYGSGLLNGEYQFNTKYRKNEMCRTVQSSLVLFTSLHPSAGPTRYQDPWLRSFGLLC